MVLISIFLCFVTIEIMFDYEKLNTSLSINYNIPYQFSILQFHNSTDRFSNNFYDNRSYRHRFCILKDYVTKFIEKKFKFSLFANPQNHLANLFVIQFAKMIKKGKTALIR